MVTTEIADRHGPDADMTQVAQPPGTLALGLDVGGSKIAACLFDVGSRTSLATRRIATRPSRGGGAVLADCATLVEELVGAAGVDATRTPLGIGICELVGPDGEITTAANFDWRGLDIAAQFRSPLLVVESDVRTAASAEAWIGAGVGRDSFIYLTVGTGIAFTLVIGGQPHAGAHGNALILGAPPVESTSSGAALSAAAGLPTAQDVFARADLGSIVAEAAEQLGSAMAWLVNALDPELIVMGGGLGLRREYRQAADEAMRRRIEAPASRDVAVVPAALGADSGAIGAARMAAGVAHGTHNQQRRTLT